MELKPPTNIEERLRLLIKNNLIEDAREIIARNKLELIIEKIHRKEESYSEFNDGILNKTRVVEEHYELRSAYSDGDLWLQKFITFDPQTISMKEDAQKIAQSPYEVLICGETGTGKELIAKSMIASREGAIKSINCAGMPETLVESILFGYVKGSFTGALKDKTGLLSSAHNGIIFLDEVGEMPLSTQAKILRAIQEKVITKVGGIEEENINCKFVFATNRNLKEMIENKLFKEDLFARISTLELNIKPLRERMCDVIPITESLEGGKEFLSKYKDDLIKKVLPLTFNVRSLQQYVIRFNILGRVV